MAQIAYVDWDGLVYYDSKIKAYIANNLEPALKDGGRVLYKDLPAPSINWVNYVYTVMEDFRESENLFGNGHNGTPHNAGTAVKVTEISPSVYVYTIFNDIRNQADQETFDDLYLQIKELKDQIDAFDLDTTDFYTKDAVDLKFSEVNAELMRQDKRLDTLQENQAADHKVLDTKADKRYVDELLENFTPSNLDNYYTKDEVDASFATSTQLAAKADNILFNDDAYEVTNNVGGFKAGDTLQSKSIAELFTTLLGLNKSEDPVEPEDPDQPDIPTSIFTELRDTQTTFYTLSTDGALQEVDFRLVTVANPEADVMENGLYQILEDNTLRECGYQVVSPDGSVNMIYYVALPNKLNFNSNADVYYYSALSDPKWLCGYTHSSDANEMVVTDNLDYLLEHFGEAATDAYNQLKGFAESLPEDYTLWLINADNFSDGKSYRFVIKEDYNGN